MITSKIDRRGRATIPEEVRSALNLQPDDRLLYVFEKDRIVVKKAGPRLSDDPFEAFSEWAEDADKRAYAGL